jgi:hypothetical protein
MSETEPFKVCTNCGEVWQDRDIFLTDPDLHLEGYQVNFMALGEGLFLFTHRTEECGSTIAITADRFTDMHDGPLFEENLNGKDGCDGSCLHTGIIDSCKAKCECAYVRDVLTKVKEWDKKG